MSKTQQLVKLLERRSIDPKNPGNYIAGYLSALVEHFEREYKSAGDFLDQEIDRAKKLDTLHY